MAAVATIKILKTSFGNFARKHRSSTSEDSAISVYKHCLELMRDGILDKDATNSFGQCFGTVIINGIYNYDNWGSCEWSLLMFQWMALKPSSFLLFESLSGAMLSRSFWRMFEQALSGDMVDLNFVVDCLARFGKDGRSCMPEFLWTKVDEAARWSPLRRAWIQATVFFFN